MKFGVNAHPVVLYISSNLVGEGGGERGEGKFTSKLYKIFLVLGDHAEPCLAPVTRQHWAAEKQT